MVNIETTHYFDFYLQSFVYENNHKVKIKPNTINTPITMLIVNDNKLITLSIDNFLFEYRYYCNEVKPNVKINQPYKS